MIIRATGSSVAITVKDNLPETLAGGLRGQLQALAIHGLPVIYPNIIRQLKEALEQLMTEDAAADRPFIAAMVISAWRGCILARDFFYGAAGLGRLAGDATGLDARAFHAVELNAVLDLWVASSGVRAIEIQQTMGVRT
jgi:hypothetical protein